MMATMQPSAITPFYAMPQLNAPIALFRGRVDLVGEAALNGTAVASCSSGSRHLRSAYGSGGAASDLALSAIMEPDSVAIMPRTPDDHVPAQPKTARGGSRRAGTTFQTGTKLLSYECGDSAAQLSHARLHIANFPRLHGRVVRWPDGPQHQGARSSKAAIGGSSWTKCRMRTPWRRS
jgi:hypothetical protein